MAEQQVSISLPEEVVRSMQARVDSGEYPSMRELIVDSVGGRGTDQDDEKLDAERFGEDFDTYIVVNRELILQEADISEGTRSGEEVLSWLRKEREPAGRRGR